MRVRAWLLGGAISAVFGCGIAAIAACSSTTATTGVVPVTGITIPASALTSGFGCGTGDGQIYKYAAIVNDPPVGAVYDCFADAAFLNLNGPSDGGYVFNLSVFMYDKAAYDANASQINAAVGASNAAAALAQIPSTFTTSCTGTETLNLQTIAQCNPISSAGPGSLLVQTNAFSLADGGSIACRAGFTAAVGGTVDGGVFDDTGDASVAQCPGPLTLGPFPALLPASATITVLNNFFVVGTTTCRATIIPNGSTTAACDPLDLP
ncbi:MAG: hypothetical protein ABI461_05305 [Polyangiaceae bacterium]